MKLCNEKRGRAVKKSPVSSQAGPNLTIVALQFCTHPVYLPGICKRLNDGFNRIQNALHSSTKAIQGSLTESRASSEMKLTYTTP